MRLSIPLLASLWLLVGCLAPSPAEAAPLVHAEPLDLPAPSAIGLELGPLSLEAGFVLRSADPRFGGLSGLWVAPGGGMLVAISDRGTFWRARLEHGDDGRLLEVRDWQAIEPTRLAGDPGGRYGGDAEALADDGRGGLVVAYESAQRLRRFAFDRLAGPPTALPRPAALAEDSNVGVEALVGLADGSLLAITEGIVGATGDLAAWRIAGDRIDDLSYVATGGFAPVGAARLAGDLYVLERRFSWLGGFATRLVVLPASAVEPGARLVGEELGRFRRPALSENFEGIAVRRGPDDRVLLYLIADDNFLALQQTLLLQLSLPARAPSAGRLDGGAAGRHQSAER